MRCRFSRSVTDHFAGASTLERDRELFAHLPQCGECRAHFERASLRERALGPDGARRDRLGAALGFRPPARAAPRTWALAAATATALVVLGWVALAPPADGGFQPRGATGAPTLGVYRLDADGRSARVAGAIATNDALAFDYSNPRGHKTLMIFAVAQSGEVYWYFPAWAPGSAAPTAVAIATGAETRELPERVRHALPPGRLTLVARFADDAPSVLEIERAVAGSADPERALGGPGRTVVVLPLEVRR